MNQSDFDTTPDGINFTLNWYPPSWDSITLGDIGYVWTSLITLIKSFDIPTIELIAQGLQKILRKDSDNLSSAISNLNLEFDAIVHNPDYTPEILLLNSQIFGIPKLFKLCATIPYKVLFIVFILISKWQVNFFHVYTFYAHDLFFRMKYSRTKPSYLYWLYREHQNIITLIIYQLELNLKLVLWLFLKIGMNLEAKKNT